MTSTAARDRTVDSTPVNLLGMDIRQLQQWFEKAGEKPYRAAQMMQWIHQHRCLNTMDMTVFSRALRRHMEQTVRLHIPVLEKEVISADGTIKWLLRLCDENHIESVFIPEKGRGTLCISSQAGCALNCSFCATGKEGFNRNLKSWEIIAQLWIARDQLHRRNANHTISNIVFMGMGEPLLNLRQLVPAVRILVDANGYGLSRRRVTISTAGIVPIIKKLPQYVDVSLAVSLHAANDDLRNQLVPLNRKYPIRELMDACRSFTHHSNQRRHVLFEYTLLKNINDDDYQARQLAELVKDLPCKVNLIPFNSFPGSQYECPAVTTQRRFQGILTDLGVRTFLRHTRGADIDAACGQLAGRIIDRSRRPSIIHFSAAT